jgi:subtilisin family serine protease
LFTALATLALVTGSIAVPLPVAGAPSRVRLLVTFEPGTPDAVADVVARDGATLVDRIEQLRVRVVDVPAVAADQLAGALQRNSNVERVERDGIVAATWVPTDPLWGYQWEQRQVRAPRAWGIERGTYHTVVAVVDTGVQLGHPDLKDRIVDGHDFVNDDRWANDDNGHGTSVAGIIAASANSIGVAGMCAKCRIMPVKALDAKGMGMWSIAAEAIVWAADHHADVINLSFGGPSGGTTLGDAIAYARSKGAVVVAAAGNFGSTTPFYPAAYPGVISVAATDAYDLQYSWSDYSSSWVDVAAPGCTWTTVRLSDYGSFCGTSAATPVVAGIAALMDSARFGISRSEIESILTAATIRTPWSFTRYGRVDAYRAVYRTVHGTWPSTPQLLPQAPLLSPADEVTLAAGDHAAYRFDSSGAMIHARSVTLEADAVVHTSKRAAIPARSGYWFYLVDGVLGGYWVHQSATTYLTPDPTPTPAPSTSPSASPTPTPAATP